MHATKTATRDPLVRTDAEYTRFSSRIVPYSIDKVWACFADYLELQEFMHEGRKVRLEGLGAGGVGTVIAFDWNGSTVREELVQKDELTYTWRIAVPGETALFKRYSFTVRLTPITEATGAAGATLVSLEQRAIPQKSELAGEIFARIDPLTAGRLARFTEFVHLKNGYHVAEISSVMDLPADRLWAIISNWSDVSWVLGAKSVEIDPRDPYLRKIRFEGYSVTERLVKKDDDTLTLTYQLLGGSFPVSYYRGTIQLTPGEGGKTSQTYSLLFVPKAEVDAEAVKKTITARLQAGIEFINKTLGQHREA